MNKIHALRAAVAAAVFAVGTSAMAALPAGAAEAIEAYKDDTLSAIGLVIGAGIAIYAVRKLGQKMGWL
ncbi:hypothetical protein [Variovorax sp. Root473]|uniref:hypothetical protein n=1 Tax=Variovorax sp. Root473 TaxID=1736541 RepID=UPI0006FD9B73|nr:hypothetical protein [Variovorax sp. Root473]KQX87688.1 hypothetical protein ASD34_15595 [Variovorax sp. Root473]